MAVRYTNLNPEQLNDNVFKLIGKDWMLITAGVQDKYNMMTASWGGLGVLWHKPVSFIFVRPNRYTFEFIQKNELFTLSFFEEKFRDKLSICGTKSGRDMDKTEETGLTPVFSNLGTYFKEARIVMQCKKMYYQDLNPAQFLDHEINNNYPGKDYHRMYIGEILQCLTR